MSIYSIGTVDIRVGSNRVTGNNTDFSTFVTRTDAFKLSDSNDLFEIAVVESASELTLVERFRDYRYETSRTSEHLATTAGATLSYTATLSYIPLIQSTLVVTGSSETWTDSDGSGTLSCTSSPTGSSGTIDYDTGALSLTYSEQPTTDYNITASYTSGDSITGKLYQIVRDFTYGFNLQEAHKQDVNYQNIYTRAVRLVDTALTNLYTFVRSGASYTLTATTTFTQGSGNTFFAEARNGDKNFSATGSFEANTEVRIVNTGEFNILFTSASLNATITACDVGRFFYNGARWYTDL